MCMYMYSFGSKHNPYKQNSIIYTYVNTHTAIVHKHNHAQSIIHSFAHSFISSFNIIFSFSFPFCHTHCDAVSKMLKTCINRIDVSIVVKRISNSKPGFCEKKNYHRFVFCNNYWNNEHTKLEEYEQILLTDSLYQIDVEWGSGKSEDYTQIENLIYSSWIC